MEEGVPSRKRRSGGRERRRLKRLIKKDNHDNSPPEPRRQAFQIWPRTHSPIFFHLKNPDLSKMQCLVLALLFWISWGIRKQDIKMRRTQLRKQKWPLVTTLSLTICVVLDQSLTEVLSLPWQRLDHRHLSKGETVSPSRSGSPMVNIDVIDHLQFSPSILNINPISIEWQKGYLLFSLTGLLGSIIK